MSEDENEFVDTESTDKSMYDVIKTNTAINIVPVKGSKGFNNFTAAELRSVCTVLSRSYIALMRYKEELSTTTNLFLNRLEPLNDKTEYNEQIKVLKEAKEKLVKAMDLAVDSQSKKIRYVRDVSGKYLVLINLEKQSKDEAEDVEYQTTSESTAGSTSGVVTQITDSKATPGINTIPKIFPDLKNVTIRMDDDNNEHDFTVLDKTLTNFLSQSNRPCYKFPPNTPTFGKEKSMKIADWIFIIENTVRLLNIPKKDILCAVSTYLRGTAFQMAKRYILNRNTDWDAFCNELTQTFQPIDHERITRTKFLNLKHTDNFQKFSREFQYLATQIKGMSEEDKLACFIQALKTNTKTEVILRQPARLEDAIRIASVIELAREENNKVIKTNYINVKNKFSLSNKKLRNPNLICSICNKNGHTSQYCRKSNNNVNVHKNMKSIEYNKNNGSKEIKGGYNTNNNNNRGNTSNNNYNKNNNSTRNNQVQCRRCNKIGHKERDCRVILKTNLVQCEQPKEEPTTVTFKDYHDFKVNMIVINLASKGELFIIKTSVLVDPLSYEDQAPRWIAETAIDSGATASIISYDCVKRNNIILSTSNLTYKTADNKINNVLGIVRNVLIKVEGKLSILDLVCIDHRDCDILLGLDWFKLTNAGVFPSLKKIVYPHTDQNLNLEKNHKEYIELWKAEYKKNKKIINKLQNNKDESDSENENEIDVLITEISDDPDIEAEVDWDWTKTKKNSLKPVAKLTEIEYEKFKNLLHKYRDIFAFSLKDLKTCNEEPHEIKLIDKKPIYVPPYRKSEAERKILKKITDEMLEEGIIQQSKSPYSSPVILVPKPDGSKRMCVDYRKINKITETERWPIPNVKDIFDNMGKAKYFTSIDLKSGYWQIKLHESSIPVSAFSTPDGHFEFLKLPFGLKNAPPHFCRMMKKIFGHQKFVEVFYDDIGVFSESIEEHLKHLEIVFKLLKEANLCINPDKCTFFAVEIKMLGHIISEGAIKMDQAKLDVIKNRLPPYNVKTLQEFLGICNYYRRFIKDFASICNPLFKLLVKDVKFEWTNECQNAFDELKNCLISYPILRVPDLNKPFILHTDASSYGIGVILSQVQDGVEYAVDYGSRLLKGAEKNYGITEKECLAVVYGVKLYRNYLYGTRFTIITDHSALKWLMNIKDPAGRLARWAIYLQAFEFEIIHKKGSTHSNVDAISRPVLINTTINSIQISNNTDELNKCGDIHQDEPLKYFVKTGFHVAGASTKQVKRIELLAKHYKYDFNFFWFKGKSFKKGEVNWLKIPEPEIRNKLILEAHLLGHFGINSTYERLRENFYWYKMLEDIKKVVKSCEPCQRNQKLPIENHPAKTIKVTEIFEIVSIDFTFGFPETVDGHIGIANISEYLTGYPYIKAIKSKNAYEGTDALWEYCCLFGPPKIILSDQGKEFCNEMLDGLLKRAGIEHRITSAYHPRTNGKAERFNQTFVSSLRKHAENNQRNWHLWIPFICYSYRSRVHSTTGYSPFELMFGIKMNSFSYDGSEKTELEVAELAQRALELKNLVENIRPKALDFTDEKRVKQMINQDEKSKIRKEMLNIGTRVNLKKDGIISKLDSRYSGPYVIISHTLGGNYKLEDATGEIVEGSFPLEKLKVLPELEVIDTRSYEVEKILDHKDENGKRLYLVHWKNYDDNENSWVPEDRFNTKTIINKYLKSLDTIQKTNGHSERRVLRSNSRKINMFSILGILFLFMAIASSHVSCVTEMMYCKINDNDKPLDIDNSCSFNFKKSDDTDKLIQSKLNFTNDKTRLSVLNKKQHNVIGNAYQCQKTKVAWPLTMTFWGDKIYGRPLETHIKLTPFECFEMLKTNKCKHDNQEFELLCDNQICQFIGKPTEEFSWWTTTTVFSYKCSVITRRIDALNNESMVFNKNCKVKDFVCELHDSIIVWNKDVVDSCPYTLLYGLTEFQLENGLLKAKEGGVDLVFGFDKFIYDPYCNRNLLKTSEGLYLAPPEFHVGDHNGFDSKSDKEDHLLNPKAILDLMLVEMDTFSNKILFENIKLFLLECNNFKNLLKIYSSFNDKFFKIKDYKNKDTVLFAKYGSVFKPNCVKIYEFDVNITKNTKECYEDIPITFKFNETIRYGFLTNDGIIKDISAKTQCNKHHFIFKVSNYYAVIKIANRYEVVKGIDTEKLFKKINFLNFEIYNDFRHLDFVKEGFDVLSTENSVKLIHEEVGSWFINEEEIQKESTLQIIVENAEDGFNKYIKKYKYYWASILITFKVILILTTILSLIFILWKLKALLSYLRCKRCKKYCFNKKMKKVTFKRKSELINDMEMRSLSEVDPKFFGSVILK